MIKLHEQSELDREQTIRRLRNGKYNKGHRIAYHEGDFADEVGATLLGKQVRALWDAGLVHLFQQKVASEPRRYVYFVEVK